MRRRPKPMRSGSPGWAPMATPCLRASSTVFRITCGSPPWKPQPTLAGVASMEAAGQVGGGDVRHDALVVAEGPAAVALAHVAVDVDVCRHSFGKTSLATRSACAGS